MRRWLEFLQRPLCTNLPVSFARIAMQLLHRRMTRYGHNVVIGRAAVREPRRSCFPQSMNTAPLRQALIQAS